MNLLLWIAKNEMTESAFIEGCAISKGSFYQYKSTSRKPSILNAVRISKATNGEVSVKELMDKSAFSKEF